MKRVHMCRSVASLVLVCALAASAVAQGVVWESKITGIEKGEQGEKEKLVKTLYMPGKMRMEGDERNIVIMRLDQEKMYMVNMKEKTYQVMTFADLEKQIQGANAQMEKLNEQMKNMPEEQRKMMEKMMGGKMPGKPKDMKLDIERTSESKSVGGFSCTKYVAKSEGKEVGTIWATKDIKDFATMKKDLEVYAKRFSSMSSMASKGLGEAMAKVDGFPMVVTTEGGITTTVTKIEQRSTPDSAFEVPAGFQKVEMKGMKEMKGEEKSEEKK